MIILLFKTGSEKDLKRLKSHRPKLNVHCFYFVKNLFCQQKTVHTFSCNNTCILKCALDCVIVGRKSKSVKIIQKYFFLLRNISFCNYYIVWKIKRNNSTSLTLQIDNSYKTKQPETGNSCLHQQSLNQFKIVKNIKTLKYVLFTIVDYEKSATTCMFATYRTLALKLELFLRNK